MRGFPATARANITDLASTHGTFINGWKAPSNVPAPLLARGRISFGGAAVWQVVME